MLNWDDPLATARPPPPSSPARGPARFSPEELVRVRGTEAAAVASGVPAPDWMAGSAVSAGPRVEPIRAAGSWYGGEPGPMVTAGARR